MYPTPVLYNETAGAYWGEFIVVEFEIDDEGNAVCVSSDRIDGFNIYEVEQELIMAAHKVQEAYKKGFKPCPIEKNCEFCNEYVYGL